MPYKDPEKQKEAQRKYYQTKKKKVIERTSRYKKLQSLEKKRQWHYQNKYGLTSAEVQQMAKAQNNACYICEEVTELVVDHCHSTHKVRGLLCRQCNMAIGMLKDDVNRLQKAIKYITGKGGSCGI